MSKVKAKIGPPKDATDFSSNWKKLLSTMEPTKKRKRKASEDQQKDHKRKKTDKSSSGKYNSATNKFEKGNKYQEKNTVSAEETGNETAKKNEIWFDDVDEMLLERSTSKKDSLLLDNAVTHITKAVAMDCEMVGTGSDGDESVLARVSVVNQHGHCVYDRFVRPREKVTDFRTHVSGVRPHNLRDATDFLVVQKKISELLKGRILVGHALHNDLKVLFLDHPRKQIRDTSRFKPFRQLCGGRSPSLKKLAEKVLGVEVQKGEHSSVQDAQAAMRLYMMHRKRWEAELATHRRSKAGPGKKKKKKAATGKTVTFVQGS